MVYILIYILRSNTFFYRDGDLYSIYTLIEKYTSRNYLVSLITKQTVYNLKATFEFRF